MKYYVVGTAEPFYAETTLLGFKEREFSENDLLENLGKMDDIPFFESLINAMDYARSLRIQHPSKIFDPEKIKFAPVIEIECDDSDTLEVINQHAKNTLIVKCSEYIDKMTNFGELRTRNEEVSCRLVPKSSIDLTTVQIKSLLLPDSGRQKQYFTQNQSCTLF